MTNLAHISSVSLLKVIQLMDSPLKTKLMEMGLLEGQEIKWLFQAPFGGPIAIQIQDYILSLRKDEASFVQVEPVLNRDNS